MTDDEFVNFSKNVLSTLEKRLKRIIELADQSLYSWKYVKTCIEDERDRWSAISVRPDLSKKQVELILTEVIKMTDRYVLLIP